MINILYCSGLCWCVNACALEIQFTIGDRIRWGANSRVMVANELVYLGRRRRGRVGRERERESPKVLQVQVQLLSFLLSLSSSGAAEDGVLHQASIHQARLTSLLLRPLLCSSALVSPSLRASMETNYKIFGYYPSEESRLSDSSPTLKAADRSTLIIDTPRDFNTWKNK